MDYKATRGCFYEEIERFQNSPAIFFDQTLDWLMIKTSPGHLKDVPLNSDTDATNNLHLLPLCTVIIPLHMCFPFFFNSNIMVHLVTL